MSAETTAKSVITVATAAATIAPPLSPPRIITPTDDCVDGARGVEGFESISETGTIQTTGTRKNTKVEFVRFGSDTIYKEHDELRAKISEEIRK